MVEMRMRIKKDFLPCFLPVIAVLCFVILAPAFAQFNKVNECELARTNASLTGEPATILCPTTPESEESECRMTDLCTAIPAEREPAANEGRLSYVDNDHEYDWLHEKQIFEDVHNPAAAALSPLTIEAGTSNGLYAPFGATYIRIGLGSQEVGLDSWDMNVTLGSEAADSEAAPAACCINCLCSIHLDGLSVKTNGSTHVTLYKTDGRMGLGVSVDAAIDRISLAALSLGDCDGYKGTNSFGNDFTKAGYVGLKDTFITGVTVSGSMGIDVMTDDVGGKQKDSITKFIHMALGNLDDDVNISMKSLDTTLVLGDKKDFSGTVGVLGTIYMNNLQMQANGYLDIYNPAANNEATTLGFGLKIPLLKLDTLAWGDSDGFAGATGAGYRGWRNLTINNLSITGDITLYENTVQAGDTDTKFSIGTTFVNLNINNVNVSMAYMTRDVALGNSKDNLNQVLRSVSWSNVSLGINTGTIQIAPH